MPVQGALTGKLADFAETIGKFALVGNEDWQTLLDGEANGAARADELLILAGKRGNAAGIERTAELGEEGVVHAG